MNTANECPCRYEYVIPSTTTRALHVDGLRCRDKNRGKQKAGLSLLVASYSYRPTSSITAAHYYYYNDQRGSPYIWKGRERGERSQRDTDSRQLSNYIEADRERKKALLPSFFHCLRNKLLALACKQPFTQPAS